MDPANDGDEGANAPKIVGHAALFNSLSQDLGGFREQIAPGAFADSIKSDDIRALWNHDPNYVLGRNKSGTLILKEDKQGLAIECTPPDATWAEDLLVSMRRGDVDQMSFGFQTIEDHWDETEGGYVRTLLKVKLFDVSPVTYPAYTETSVAVRSSLKSVGIDYDNLSGIILRSQRGLPLTKADRDIIQASIEVLTGLAESRQASGPASVGNGQTQERSISILRKKLELIEKAN
jgi:HK97 family phage prohead protease